MQDRKKLLTDGYVNLNCIRPISERKQNRLRKAQS